MGQRGPLSASDSKEMHYGGNRTDSKRKGSRL